MTFQSLKIRKVGRAVTFDLVLGCWAHGNRPEARSLHANYGCSAPLRTSYMAHCPCKIAAKERRPLFWILQTVWKIFALALLIVVAVAQVHGSLKREQHASMDYYNHHQGQLINRWKRQAESLDLAPSASSMGDEAIPTQDEAQTSETYDRYMPIPIVWLAHPAYNFKRVTGVGGSRGFHGDTFTSGFGDFSTMKRNSDSFKFHPFAGYYDNMMENKRVTGNGGRGFHGDTFTNGFGDFSTMKRSE